HFSRQRHRHDPSKEHHSTNYSRRRGHYQHPWPDRRRAQPHHGGHAANRRPKQPPPPPYKLNQPPLWLFHSVAHYGRHRNNRNYAIRTTFRSEFGRAVVGDRDIKQFKQ